MSKPRTIAPDVAAMRADPGANGVLARLAVEWNPDAIGDWLREEHQRGTPPAFLTRALGNLMAAAAWGLAMQTSSPLEAGKDIQKAFEAAMANKANRHSAQQAGGVFLPSAAEIANLGGAG